MFFNRVGTLGDLSLLVDLSVVDNAAIVPLAISCIGGSFLPLSSAWSVSFDLAGFLSSAEPFLLPAFHSSGFLSSAEPFLLLAFDLPGFLSSAELFLLLVSVCPCFIGPFGFVNSFVDSAAIVLPALSLPSVELPSSTDVALFPAGISSLGAHA